MQISLRLRPVLFLSALLLSATCSPLSAQNLYDAYRLAEQGPTGTARSRAMGGAFTAVGGDYSAGALNPAGFGVYRSSQLQITPSLNVISSQSETPTSVGSYSDQTNRTNLSLTSIGLVVTNDLGKTDGFKSFTFAIGYNQLANFHRRITTEIFNPTNSVSTWIAENATGLDANTIINDNLVDEPGPQFYPDQAYLTFVNNIAGEELSIINNLPGEATLYRGVFEGGDVNQRLDQLERGRHNEWNLSLAGNFSDRIFIGGGLGISDVRYNFERSLSEADVSNVYNAQVVNAGGDSIGASSIQLNEEYLTRGAGINASFGIIAVPVDILRLGLSIKTPTWMALNDVYSNSMSITADDGQTATNTSFEGEFDYNYVAPFQLNTGLMVLLGEYGFISADFGFSDYSTGQFTSQNTSNASFNLQNSQITDLLTTAWNTRVGIEGRYDEFYARAGFAYYATGYTEEARLVETPFGTLDSEPNAPPVQTETAELQRFIYSGGLGYRGDVFFLDFAYVHDIAESLVPYYGLLDLGYSSNGAVHGPVAKVERTMGSVMFTAGVNFGN